LNTSSGCLLLCPLRSRMSIARIVMALAMTQVDLHVAV
jgi:hypothetical protein